jgi:glycine C-acetyltransferase
MKDLFEKLRQDKGPLGNYADVAEGYFVFPKLEGPISNRMKFNGKEMITWSINNYLGLANHPEVRKVDAESAAKWGLAYPMGARPMSGQTVKHEQLEQELADFVNKEAAYLLNFGYQGNVSIIDSLVNKNDVIVYDSDSHASIIDGCRLHQGKRFTFEHNNVQSLEKMLERAEKIAEKNNGGILVITEGVFGMRGEQGKLKEIVALKDKYNFRLLVDDAHGFGTLGETGAGAGEAQGVQDDIDVYFATFAKSMAGFGAFVAGDKDMIQYLKYNMRSQVFAKSLTMPMVEGGLKRLELLKTRPELKEKLWEIATNLQKGLRDAGFDLGSTDTVITPVYLKGSVPEAMVMVKDLREKYNIFTSIVIYPVIPKGMILLRLIPTAVHTQEDIDETVKAFSAIREKLETGVYKRIGEEFMKKMRG